MEKLTAGDLRKPLDISFFPFETTAALPPSADLIGQKRAEEALNFGIRIHQDGFHIYMCGQAGEGKTRYALNCTQKAAKSLPVPDDWVYVHNFDLPEQPKAMALPAGSGKTFKQDMEDFIRIIEQEIVKAFDGEDYQSERTRIVRQFKDKKDLLVVALNQEAMKREFKVKMNTSGIYFLPVIDGDTVDEESFKELDEEVKSTVTRHMELLQKESADTVRKIREVESEAEEAVKEWESRIALYAVGMHMDDLRDKYTAFPLVLDYLERVRSDILNNLNALRTDDFGDDQQAAFMQMMMKRNQEDDPRERYRINLLVDNSNLSGAPVVIDYNPTYQNMMGRCDYENEMGSLTTDFMHVKPGLFHQANGGFLIIQMNDLIMNPQSFDAIKRTLKTKLITVEPPRDQSNLMGLAVLKPQPIPVDVKVILVGSNDIYQLLVHLDIDFKKLFKIKAEFDDEMSLTAENVHKLSQFISSWCMKERLLHLDAAAVASVVRHCSRLVEHQEKLTTHFNDIAALLVESSAWAEIDGATLVGEPHVRKAIDHQKMRAAKINDDLLEMVTTGDLLIDTEGAVVGQINGLAVLNTGDASFGKPSRITATTYVGKKGIIDIEREVDTGGSTHTKGILILSGYMGNKFSQEKPLSFGATLCFEQMYGGVDGDSASSTELYALLSSLAEVPIDQGIAVTGSVNQYGQIQPIGGATYKVEGFFQLCCARGLNGRQGVALPIQNVKNLVLSDEVIDAVAAGLFHIWAIKTVDEGIALLTDMEAGVKGDDGTYPENSVNGRVYVKLGRYADTAAKYAGITT